MRKTRLKPRSDKKEADELLYRAEKLARGGVPPGYQAHHPLRRLGDKILCFCIIPTTLHEKIEASGKWAREAGWLADSVTDKLPRIVPCRVQDALDRWFILTGKTIERKD